MRNETLHRRTLRECLSPGCTNKPEPKDRLCLACQLAGRVVIRRGPKGLEVISTDDPRNEPP